ncbi:MAG: response regulator [Lachnospiraceae bacterium]|jgi:signal transduction histidine kinase/DNA-binding response OmpR family regulator|nr:response regulator [Lachnospiraceae bacterium]
MEKQENNFLLENEMRINHSIGMILCMGCLVGPVMYILTQFGIFKVELRFCAVYTLYTIVFGLIQQFLTRTEKLHTVAKYFGMFAFESIIGMTASRASVMITIGFTFATLLSCLYVSRRLTRVVWASSYIVMLIAVYVRVLEQAKRHMIVESAHEYFLGTVFGYTIEFAFLYFISMMIIKYEQHLLQSQEAEVNERIEAEQANRAKSVFLAQMSHEIRTPINAVLGMNEMIMRETNQGQIVGYSRTIQSAGKSLLNIVNDILDFSKIQSGKMEIMHLEYDIAQMIRDLLELYGVQAMSKGLDFEYQISEEIPRLLEGDEYRIKQAAGNLISNAIKYTEKGFVNFQADFVRDDKEAKEGKLILSVVDSGIGIKSEDIPKLFQDFGRLDVQKNRAIEGTGLGLNISKQLIEMMNGTMSVQSVYGEGSIFAITIPQKIVSEEVVGDFTEEMKRREEAGIRLEVGKTVLAESADILVVDDNEMNLQVVASLLKKSQAKVECVLSGEKCLEAVAKKKYDLILLDHMMPQMDGIEVLHRLRGEEKLCDEHTKIVVLTANAIAGAKENYLNEGFDDYLSKPIVLDELDRVLLEHLPAKKVQVVDSDLEQEVEEKPAYPNLEEFGIDVKAGVELLDGDFDVYLEMAQVFYNDYATKHQKMQEAFSQEDMETYSIYVHGLKSNARTLGAMELGELAYTEELKSKDGDFAFIQSHIATLEAEWDKVRRGFEILFVSQGITSQPADKEDVTVTGEVLDETEIVDRLLITLACLEEFQEDEAREGMKELLSHPLPEDLQAALKEALDNLYQFDYKKAFAVLSPFIADRE